MAIPGKDPVPRCSPEQWEEFRQMVRHGMLFEVIEWLDAGKPSLRPEGKTTSAFESALVAPNLSMTQVLWERGWQEEWEVHRAIGSMTWENPSKVVLRYLLEADCPMDGLTGYDLCLTHDLELVRLGISKGVDILEPDGWASAFVRVGSRPLIRIYLEQRDQIPGLRVDAVYAMCRAIKESRLRAFALLRWAGIDPLGKAPRYEDWDDPEEEWQGFPLLRLPYSKKPLEVLKLLKNKPTVCQWFELVDGMTHSGGEPLEAVLNLMPDPMGVMRRHPTRAARLLTGNLQTLCWGWSWSLQRDEMLVEFCFRLLDEGVTIQWRDADSINRLRRDVYKTERKKEVFRVLRRAAELAGPRERETLILLVNKPKMRELTIQHEPTIMHLLELLPPVKPLSRPRRPRRACPSGSATEPASPPEPRIEACESDVAWSSAVSPEKPKPPAKKPHEIKRGGYKVLERKLLHAELWAEPAMHVAARHGISGSMLARICTKLEIPRPPRGYWAKPKGWRSKHKKRLPKWKGEGADFWVINPTNVRAQRASSDRSSAGS